MEIKKIEPVGFAPATGSNKRFVTLDEAIEMECGTSGMDTIDVMLHSPVRRGELINPQVLNEKFTQAATAIASASSEVWGQVHQRQQIDAHNAAIDEAKAKKRQLRAIAKQARIPVEAVKRMVKSVQRVK